MIRLLRSTSIRLALGHAVLFAVSLLLLFGFLWWRTVATLDREVNAVILADGQAVADSLRDRGLAGAVETINERVGKTGDIRAVYLLADPLLLPVAGNLGSWPRGIGRKTGWYQLHLTRRNTWHATRVLYVALPSGFNLLVGRDIEDRVAIQQAVVDRLGWTAVLAVLLAVGGGLWLRRAVLQRIAAIDRTTTAIIRGDLSHRLPARNSADEFDRLSGTINGLLQQIEILVDGVRNSTNAVAHDLRTPLTELRGRLEGLLRNPPPPEAMQRQIGEAVADLDRLIAVFNALLRLAEIDSGARLSGFREVGLAEAAAEVADLYGPLAEERGVAFSFAAEAATVFGDPFLLTQAIGNLVDNALKYCPRGKTVSLRVGGADGRAEVTVSDTGPGIPDAEKPRVTDRFFRGSAGRGTAGVGLGLSLVAAVARLHDGELSFADADPPPGLVVRLTLPMAAVQ